jgi:FkbM family methyltransferase
MSIIPHPSETADFVIDKLRQLKAENYCIVDVGARHGLLLHLMKHKFDAKYIGIDPAPNTGHPAYDEFYSVAIDDVITPEIRKFYIYPDEPGCNSLLPMRKDIITHNLDEYDSKWYVEWDIEKNETVIDVPVISLEFLLKHSQIFNEIGVVHFLKVDSQGNDANVVKSLGDILKKTYIVQIESVVHPNKNISLYNGQPHYIQDVDTMHALGFVQVQMTDYSINKNACPEADIVFINKELFFS